MLNALQQWFRGGDTQAVSQLAPVPPPKVRPNQQSLPSYVTSAAARGDSVLPRTDNQLANTDATSVRSGSDSRDVIRKFSKSTPDLSAAVFAYQRLAVSEKYTAVARNEDGTFNREATLLLQQLLSRFDTVQDYSDGFSGIQSIRSIAESLSKELLWYGACSMELVLGKDRLPRSLQPISVTQVQFKQDKTWLKPVQKIGSEEIDLDIPTFFYVSLDQDLKEPYSDPPFEAALQPVLADHEFFNDLRRLVKKALHPRLDVEVNAEKFRATVPSNVLADPELLAAYTTSVMRQVEEKVSGLNPEDALIHFDFLKFTFLNHNNASPAGEEEILQGIARSRLAAGSKTLPSVLGHGGNQNAASAEAMLFMKNADGIRSKLNEIFSKVLTLALRLFALEVQVRFEFAPIDMRPENELEAFSAMKQSRILELLSLGLLTDDEASISLTGRVSPTGMQPLSGTMFKGNSAPVVDNAPYSTTGSAGSKQGPVNQAAKPATPTKPKS